jgi:hypothetical protein
VLMGVVQQRPVAPGPRRASSAPQATPAPVYIQPAPTVEIIRGDKRSQVTVG